MKFLKSIVYRLPQGWQRGLRNWHYFRKLSAAKLEDEAELGVVPLLVKPGNTVMDIGANFGLFTRFLSEAVGDGGQVFSFEPTQDMFEVLSHNVKRSGFSNVKCCNVALSDESGEAEIYIPRRPDGTLNHYEACLRPVNGSSDNVANRVQVLPVDQFCEDSGIERVDFIKCDVEGHEIAVLKGAEQLISSCHPAILLEVNEPLCDGGHGSRVRELVESFGYTIHIYENGKVSPWQPEQVRVNYLLLPAQ